MSVTSMTQLCRESEAAQFKIGSKTSRSISSRLLQGVSIMKCLTILTKSRFDQDGYKILCNLEGLLLRKKHQIYLNMMCFSYILQIRISSF